MHMRIAAVMAGLALGLMFTASNAAILDFSYDLAASSTNPVAVTANGTLTIQDTGTVGEYLIVGITGERNGDMITGLIPRDGYYGNDNPYFSDQPHLDSNGFSYNTASSGPVNFYFVSDLSSYTEQNPSVGFGTFTVSAVPIPASAPLFGAALIAFGAVGYGLKRKKAAATA